MRPTECKWCGAAERGVFDGDLVFTCGSIRPISGNDFQWVTCKLIVANNRIQRALAKLKTAQRYRVEPVSQTSVWYDRTPDGPLTDSVTLDDVARILEGDSDE